MSSYKIIDGVLDVYYGKAAHAGIPKDVTKIGEYAFGGRNSLRRITIPNSVIEIDNGAFCHCTNLKNIEIPNSVTKIGEQAFCNCPSLASINIPSSVTEIGYSAFEGINKVKSQYNENGALRAFKAFNKDWTCRNFQYEVGKSYHQDGNIKCCVNGFHACTNPLDVFNYYWGNLNGLHFAEVELSGVLDWGYSNYNTAASDIRIIRELLVQELFEIYNNMEKV